MEPAAWSLLVGALLVFMALAATQVARLPLSAAMLYLGLGIALSPWGTGVLVLQPLAHARWLELLAEGAVLISLFGAGLKLSPGLADRRWLLPLRLATLSMVVTVGAIALLGWLAGLPLGAAVLLGAIVAPTDPVLASDVQVRDAGDRDQVRFALTGEGGLNDGTAFPFVMLGLGLLGLHELGAWGWRWWVVDVLWAIGAGLTIGAALGAAVALLATHLRRVQEVPLALDDFLALGLIGLAYGTAVLLHAYGFLAVFAAGVALRQVEQRQARTDGEARALAQAVLGFDQQIERIAEVALVVALGALLWAASWRDAHWWLVGLLLVAIRPAATALGLAGSGAAPVQRRLAGWFGIRGVGSLYYLFYAINHGLAPEQAQPLVATTLAALVASIVLHGISVTPAMAWYERRLAARGRSP